MTSPEKASVTMADREARGLEMIKALNRGASQPTLENLRQEFPFLADVVAGFALGEVWAESKLDHRTRQIATVSAFAELELSKFMKIHAGYALNIGVTEDELKEVIYLTTVHAGMPRAIEAAQTLSELFAERRAEAK